MKKLPKSDNITSKRERGSISKYPFICASAFAKLTVEDLEKICQIVNDAELWIEKRITDQEKNISDLIQAQGKRLDFHGALIIALIVAIIGFVSVSLRLITYQHSKLRAQQYEEIKALREKIEALEENRILRV